MSNGISPAASYALECAESLLRNRKIVALTGAGVSTASGLPDYRGQGQLRRESPNWESFRDNSEIRTQHWLQTFASWDRLAQARPSIAHQRLAEWAMRGVVVGVVTQNVDGLHQRAGSTDVVELHGTDQLVLCHSCGVQVDRTAFRMRLEESTRVYSTAPGCQCGGLLRPAATFFGEPVNPERYRRASELLSNADALLVLGTSLRVNTGLHLLHQAVNQGHATVIINLGSSVGLGIADVTVNLDVNEGMEYLFERL